MLQSFSVENYLSFRRRATLSMVPDALKERPDYLHIPISYDLNTRLLKSVSIYGHNSHGKSNFLKAYLFFQYFILHSADPNQDNIIEVENFKLNSSSIKEPSFFETIFFIHNIKYRYGFRITSKEVVEEWLYYAEARVRENYLYHRIGQEVKASKSWQKEISTILDRSIHYTQKHQLLMSSLILSKITPEPIDKIASWLKGNLVVLDISDEKYLRHSLLILALDDYRYLINKLINKADLGFTTILDKIDNLAMNKLSHNKDFLNFLYQVELKEFSLYAQHNVYDDIYRMVDTVIFEFMKSESAGTLRFLVVASLLAFSIKNGQLILFDEIDSKFHSDLVQLIVQFYNDSAINVSGSQMIFTTHNTILLNDILRRDQILVVERNEYGESSISRAHTSENPIRIESSIEKEYRKGKLGGISKKIRKDDNQGSFEF